MRQGASGGGAGRAQGPARHGAILPELPEKALPNGARGFAVMQLSANKIPCFLQKKCGAC